MVNCSGESTEGNMQKLYLTGKALCSQAWSKNGSLKRCIKQ